MKSWTSKNRSVEAGDLLRLCLLGTLSLFAWPGTAAAVDLMAPKEQQNTEVDHTQLQEFDQQRRGAPQAIFVWIKLAEGFEEEWDSFGRKGWYTQDPRLKPIGGGSSVFKPETPVIYIVFESAPLEDPALFSAQWYLEGEGGKLSENPIGKDALEVPGHSRYGYLELKKPDGAWPKGNYVVKIYITPLGQQAFHAANQVGTMKFTITDQPQQTGQARP
ncbi:MAG TPA: hypothetical protein VLA99_01730 [Nitrospiraceae bacterium]|nr:hypothetical protein [Nitrospiraceae bacterium]